MSVTKGRVVTAAHPQSFDLVDAACADMSEHGFAPGFPPEVEHEVASLPTNLATASEKVRDLRTLLWSSIDNDESRDLDQIEVAERNADGSVLVRVGIADVDALVPAGSAIDRHAARNTTSVYTGVAVFPMLPEQLSTDLTSLGEGADRLAIVIELSVSSDGVVGNTDVYRAVVKNHAKLAYDSVGGWLEGHGALPKRAASVSGIDAQLQLQDEVAQKLKKRRHELGALDLETIEARPITKDGRVVDLELTLKSRARDLIEDFMIAANTAMARFLEAHHVSSIRRVVKSPERWARIVALAAELGAVLPEEPNAVALSSFLSQQRERNREGFADLSLAVVKLMGPGEYALERSGAVHTGHFGLAVQDYTHSTAPNRRYSDLITQRLVKAVLDGQPPPYSDAELDEIARHCTEKENDAKKVERQSRKQAAALLLADHIGEIYDAVVTGVTPKGTFVRLIHPAAEGRVVQGEAGMDVGAHVRVKLVETSPAKGFVDFVRANS
ncbi:MAG: RNB domain-containing ribonuclease [Polyangiales bacterium]